MDRFETWESGLDLYSRSLKRLSPSGGCPLGTGWVCVVHKEMCSRTPTK